MEKFLKLRKESLEEGMASASQEEDLQRAREKAEDERRWIDEFLARLKAESDKDQPSQPIQLDGKESASDDDSPGDVPSPPDAVHASEAAMDDNTGPQLIDSSGDSIPYDAQLHGRRGLMVSGVLRGRDIRLINKPQQLNSPNQETPSARTIGTKLSKVQSRSTISRSHVEYPHVHCAPVG